jgi:hypothetical protein
MVPIPDVDFQTLVKVLSWILKCYNGSLILNNNEAKRLHMIAIIIWAVVQLLPDVTVHVEEDLNGVRVDAHGHFEFVLIRNNVRICIFEAKKDDFEQGMAQSLVGCEVAADIDGSNVVYGVVTNFEHWIFLQSLDDRIRIDEFNAITIDAQGVNQANLLTIVGKLHSLLM